MLKVYMDLPIAEDATAFLSQHAEITSDFDHLEDVDAMLIRSHKVSRADMDRAPKLKVISRHGTGCDMLDLAAAKEKGIAIETLPGLNAEAVAELAAAFMLALSRKLGFVNAGIRTGEFKKFAPEEAYGYEAYGKTLALVGTGNIAMRVARIMKYGYNMRVIGYSRHLTDEKAAELGIERYPSVEAMLPEADYINLSLPLTDETRNIINARTLSMMKPSAIVINTSRGGIVDEAALADALEKGIIFGAATDVFVGGEPPKTDNPLLKFDNFMACPHCGPATYENAARSGMKSVENILKYFE